MEFNLDYIDAFIIKHNLEYIVAGLVVVFLFYRFTADYKGYKRDKYVNDIIKTITHFNNNCNTKDEVKKALSKWNIKYNDDHIDSLIFTFPLLPDFRFSMSFEADETLQITQLLGQPYSVYASIAVLKDHNHQDIFYYLDNDPFNSITPHAKKFVKTFKSKGLKPGPV